jgi:hypothetical protein
VEGGGPRDGLLLPLFRVEGLRFNVEAVELARLGDRDTVWSVGTECVVWRLPDARLSDCLLAGAGPVAVLDPEEAVCAVRDAGSLTGLVGDLGFGLTKPV